MARSDQAIIQHHVDAGEPIPPGDYCLDGPIQIPAGGMADCTAASVQHRSSDLS